MGCYKALTTKRRSDVNADKPYHDFQFMTILKYLYGSNASVIKF